MNKLMLFNIFFFFILFLIPVFATSGNADKDRPLEECTCGHDHEGETCEVHSGEESTCGHDHEGETCEVHSGEESTCGHDHETDPAEHIHAEGEECPSCNHENQGETGDAHNHSEGGCGLEHLHDPYLMESIIQQPWRHPEEIGRELWMKKIAPLCGLFLLAIFLRPLINKTLRKVSK